MCLALGKTLAELRALLLPGELNLYRALYRLQGPWWDERADVLHAISTAALASAFTGAPQEPRHFMPTWQPETAIELPWECAVAVMTGTPLQTPE